MADSINEHLVDEERALCDGVRILSLDGGGVRGICSLKILQDLQDRLGGKEPYEVFDVICGTSTGGLIAILLGILKFRLDECVEIYKTMSKKVFRRKGWKKIATPIVAKATCGFLYDPGELENVVKQCVREKLGNADVRLDDIRVRASPEKKIPHVFVVARTSTSDSITIFRNYKYGAYKPNKPMKAKIWEAARATSAAPTFFPPMKIDDVEYIDGGIGNNNPTLEASNEVQNMLKLKELDISCVFSIGTGLKDFQYSKLGLLATLRTIKRTAMGGENVHRQMFAQYRKEQSVLYERVNPDAAVASVKIDQHQSISQLIEFADAYLKKPEVDDTMERVSERLAASLQVLKEKEDITQSSEQHTSVSSDHRRVEWRNIRSTVATTDHLSHVFVCTVDPQDHLSSLRGGAVDPPEREPDDADGPKSNMPIVQDGQASESPVVPANNNRFDGFEVMDGQPGRDVEDAIKRCKNVDEFIGIYDREVFKCFGHLHASLGHGEQGMEKRAEKWAKDLCKGVAEAKSLNWDRKVVSVFLKTLAKRAQETSEDTLTKDQVVNRIKGFRISDPLLFCVAMDRANARYNMILPGRTKRGMNWFSAGDDTSKELEANGYPGYPTMSKHYLYLFNLKELGLERNKPLPELLKPAIFPEVEWKGD